MILPADLKKSIGPDGLLYDLYECNPKVGSTGFCTTLLILLIVGFAITFPIFFIDSKFKSGALTFLRSYQTLKQGRR